MNISFLSEIKPTVIKKLNNHTQTKTKDLGNDVFVKSSAADKTAQSFDINSAVEELGRQKTFSGKPKFNEEKLKTLTDILKKNPEKWNAVKALANQPKMVSAFVLDFAAKDTKTLNVIKDLSLMKIGNNQKFSPFEIKNLSGELDCDGLKIVGKLADTPLESDDIISIAKDKNIKDINKLKNKVIKFAESVKDKRRVTFKKDDYDENAYNIRADMPNNGSKILLLDKNLNETALETVTVQKISFDKILQIKNSIDYRNNTVSKITAEINPKMPLHSIVTDETRVVKDRNGKLIRKEIYQLSDVSGAPNIKYIYPDGSEKNISTASFDKKTGITSVFKNMTSLDGTHTEYSFEDDLSGNMISDYKITDKKGNILFNHSMTFEVVSENKFISTENGKYYEITLENDKIKVKNMQNDDVTAISFDKMSGNREKLLTSLKRMPAEELIELGKNTDELVGIDNMFQSTYMAKTRTINSGENLFTILHEAGHAKDYANVDVKQKETLINSIYSNPVINKVFEEEKAAFNKAFPLSQRDHISYFIKNSEHKDGLQEAVAETNALINTRNTENLFSVRSHYLQQYFPKTIALLAVVID